MLNTRIVSPKSIPDLYADRFDFSLGCRRLISLGDTSIHDFVIDMSNTKKGHHNKRFSEN